MSRIAPGNGPVSETAAPDNQARLEAAIAAWKADISDVQANLADRLLQTHELLDYLVRAFAERQDRVNATLAAWAEVEELRVTLGERDQALAEALYHATEQDQTLGEARSRVAELGRAIAETNSRAVTLEQALAESGVRVAELEEASSRVAGLEQALSESSVRVVELERALAEAQANVSAAGCDELAELQSKLSMLEQARDALEGDFRAAQAALESEKRTYLSAAQQQAQWKNELAQDLAAQTRARRALDTECQALRAENMRLRIANETLAADLESKRLGAPSAPRFQVYDESGQKRRLGEMLVDAGYLTSTQLDEALREQASLRETRLGTILVNKGLVREDVVAEGLAFQLQAAS